MNFIETALPGVRIIEPRVHRDRRGFFLEVWHQEKYRDAGLTEPIVQFNHSRSGRGTLRGLHAQLEPPQGKLIRVVEGAVFDVAVDIRRGSPTFGRWAGAELTADSFRQLWIPAGFAHGFAVLSDVAQVEYGCTGLYDPAGEIAVAWNDPRIGVRWPITDPVMSERDAAAPPLEKIDRLPRYAG